MRYTHVYETEGDVTNGGLDQVVWNCGSARAREIAETFTEVGAVGNGALIAQLADHLESYESEQPDGSVERDVAAHFGSYRARVAGPYFPVPELKEEVGLALCEYVRSRLGEVPAASAPLTWVD